MLNSLFSNHILTNISCIFRSVLNIGKKVISVAASATALSEIVLEDSKSKIVLTYDDWCVIKGHHYELSNLLVSIDATISDARRLIKDDLFLSLTFYESKYFFHVRKFANGGLNPTGYGVTFSVAQFEELLESLASLEVEISAGGADKLPPTINAIADTIAGVISRKIHELDFQSLSFGSQAAARRFELGVAQLTQQDYRTAVREAVATSDDDLRLDALIKQCFVEPVLSRVRLITDKA